MYKPKKSLGQNFLKNENIISDIVKYANIHTHDQVIEIGPGFGALTKKILAITKEIQVIEIDKDLIEPLKMACINYGQLNIKI